MRVLQRGDWLVLDPNLEHDLEMTSEARHYGIEVVVGERPMGHLSQAAGVAWAMRIRGEARVVLATLDGASTSDPDVHNGLNFAAVQKVPVVFWARIRGRHPPSLSLSVAYGLWASRVEDSGSADLEPILSEAVRHARSGSGPALVEAPFG